MSFLQMDAFSEKLLNIAFLSPQCLLERARGRSAQGTFSLSLTHPWIVLCPVSPCEAKSQGSPLIRPCALHACLLIDLWLTFLSHHDYLGEITYQCISTHAIKLARHYLIGSLYLSHYKHDLGMINQSDTAINCASVSPNGTQNCLTKLEWEDEVAKSMRPQYP